MEPMDYVNIGAFTFSMTATIAAIIAARWGWLDRPQVAFRFNASRERAQGGADKISRKAAMGWSATSIPAET